MLSASGRLEGSLHLRDGRRLSYAEYGDPDGEPVLLFHGNPGSRLFWGLLPGSPFRPALRLIAPDRPGFGLSDFNPHGSFASWPADIVELADALELKRFAVVGLSGGGPFALACAWKLPERLRAVGVISSVGPFDVPGATEGMGRANRRLFAFAGRAPGVARSLAPLAAVLMRRAPEAGMKRLAFKFPEADRTILARPEVHALVRGDFPEAFRQGGKGPVHELILYARPWRFPVDQIETEVWLWHGEADRSVGATGRYLAATLPNCRANLIPGAGHFWIIDNVGVVLDTLHVTESS